MVKWYKTRKNCFRYLKLMSPLNAAICTTTYLERQKCYGPDKKILLKKTLFDHATNNLLPTYQISLTFLEKNNYLTLRSKSHEGHYSTRHTALWSCTHKPNIIDLSGKTKELWSGQASLRRSWRKKSHYNNMSPLGSF